MLSCFHIGNFKSSAGRAFLTGLIILALLAVLLPNLMGESAVSGAGEPSGSVTDNNAVELADANGVMFILRSVDGRVAVLNSLETGILEVLDISVSALPEPYAAELEGGIIIGSVSELVSVICGYEEFTSALQTSHLRSSLAP